MSARNREAHMRTPLRIGNFALHFAVYTCEQTYYEPDGWRAAASSIITIPDTGGTHGLTYAADGKLITRTVAKSSYFSADYVGEANYKIFGAPTTDAAWVTTGKDLTTFYDTRGYGATNTELIKTLEQGLGMNDTGTHDAVIEFAVWRYRLVTTR